jgi:hypothetical protein
MQPTEVDADADIGSCLQLLTLDGALVNVGTPPDRSR